MRLENYSNTEEAIQAALSYGLEIIEADDRTLLLDIDSNEALSTYTKCISILEKVEGTKETDRWVSKSGRGWHIVVGLSKPRSAESRLRLQALLGSDPVREALHWKTLKETGEVRVLAFKPRSK